MIRTLALLLLAGSVLLLGATALHPLLPLTGEGDLQVIAATGRWHLVHLGLLYGTGLIIAGVWARWFAAAPGERAELGVGLGLLVLGQVLNGVNIAYMLGAGTHLAALPPDAALAPIYQAMHHFAVGCGRLGGFLVALAAGLIGWSTGREPGEPRWLAGIAWLACVAGLAGNFLAPPGHPLMLTAVGVMGAWQIGTAVRLLRVPVS